MKIIYRISSGFNLNENYRDVTPYSGKDLKLTWNREDERRYDFKKELKEITLLRDDYRHFLALETSQDRCDLQTLSVYLDCNGNEQDYFLLFRGTFSMSNGQWDLDRCTVKFELEPKDPYKCIEENDEDENILGYDIPRKAKLRLKFGNEAYLCLAAGGSDDIPDCSEQFIEQGKWTFIKKRHIFQDFDEFGIAFLYARHYLVCDCNYEPSSEWTLLEECEEGEKKYVKPIVGNPENIADVNDRGDIIIFEEETIQEIDNGRKLHEVMEGLLFSSCNNLNLNIVSDFFQWNPENVSDINYVTGELNKLTNILIFQKSDVKRPYTSNNATKGETNFIDLLEQIIEMFNLGYKMIGNNILRIEHISWFETDLGINLMAIDKKRLLRGTKKYSYDKTKLPKYEKFEFMEAGSEDFVGSDIVYDSNCVNNNQESKSEIKVDNITTDIMYCMENPDPDGEVSDDGFVLIACDQNYNVFYEDGILTNNTVVNNVLSWAHLHRDFWKHGRVLREGTINGQPIEFETIVPTIKQDQFSVVMDCKYLKLFDPLDKLNGSLGWGFLSSAELQLSKCSMSIELLLDTIEQTTYEEILGDFDSDFSDEFD